MPRQKKNVCCCFEKVCVPLHYVDQILSSCPKDCHSYVYLRQEPVTLLGQIGCDSNGKLNHKSVILEGDREHSSGAQIPVDLSELKEYSLFPGQVRSGASPTGHGRACLLRSVCRGLWLQE